LHIKFRPLLLVLILVIAISAITSMQVGGEGVIGLLSTKSVAGNVSSMQAVSMQGVANSWIYVCRWCMPNAPVSYNFGTLNQGDTAVTGLAHFTVQNYGVGAIDVAISAEDMTGVGTDWTLSDTATAGADTYGLKAGLSGDDYNIIVKKSSPYNNLVAGLAAAGSQDWGLKIYAPTTFSDWNDKFGNVTLTASIS
jgi:hypothetical protein